MWATLELFWCLLCEGTNCCLFQSIITLPKLCGGLGFRCSVIENCQHTVELDIFLYCQALTEAALVTGRVWRKGKVLVKLSDHGQDISWCASPQAWREQRRNGVECVLRGGYGGTVTIIAPCVRHNQDFAKPKTVSLCTICGCGVHLSHRRLNVWIYESSVPHPSHAICKRHRFTCAPASAWALKMHYVGWERVGDFWGHVWMDGPRPPISSHPSHSEERPP